MPDTVVDTTTNQNTHQFADGSWYLHVRTRDVAGNWNAGAAHFGPYKIDTTPPTNPTISSSTHTPGVWSKNPAVHLSWTGASDGAGSGVVGYSQFWDDAATTDPGTTVNTTSTSAISTRYDGTTYFHLRTKDAAGNWSAPIHFGPLKIDTVAPTTQINAPAQVSNKTFAISWSGSDATSGAHFYEVRYRDMTVGTHAWQTLKGQTITTGASFTGQDGHKYDFQARATDYAGNVQAWSTAPMASTAIATVDFSAIGLEVTQAVQDLNNSVPLVEGKRTFARFHVKSAAGDHGPVSAQLNLYRNGQFVQAIMASNPNSAITVRQNPDRGQLQDSFYFDLPASWLNGTITLEGRISSGWAQTDPNNDTAAATITFTGVPPLRVWILDMCYTWNGTDHDVPWSDIDAITSYLRRMYPISNLVVPGVAILTPCLSAWQGEQSESQRPGAHPPVLGPDPSLGARLRRVQQRLRDRQRGAAPGVCPTSPPPLPPASRDLRRAAIRQPTRTARGATRSRPTSWVTRSAGRTRPPWTPRCRTAPVRSLTATRNGRQITPRATSARRPPPPRRRPCTASTSKRSRCTRPPGRIS